MQIKLRVHSMSPAQVQTTAKVVVADKEVEAKALVPGAVMELTDGTQTLTPRFLFASEEDRKAALAMFAAGAEVLVTFEVVAKEGE